MRRLSSRWQRISTVLIAVCMLLIAVGYFFLHYSSQKRNLTDRIFRALAIASDQLGSKIENYGSVLSQAAKASTGESGKAKTQAAHVYLAQLVRELTPRQCGYLEVGPRVPAGFYAFVNGREGESYILNLYLRRSKAEDNICATSRFDDLFSDIAKDIPQDLFDDIMVADEQSVVVYQRSQTGTRIASLDDLVRQQRSDKPDREKPVQRSVPENDHEKLRDFKDVAAFSNVVSLNIGGLDYEMFLQPVALAGVLALDVAPARFYICGLIRSDQFRSRSTSLPGPLTIWFILAIALSAAFTWPVLKVRVMNATERIKRREPCWMLLSGCCGVFLVTLAILGITHSHLRYWDRTDGRLAAMAEQIDRNFASEMEHLLATIQTLTASQTLADDEVTFTKKIKDNNVKNQNCAAITSTEEKIPTFVSRPNILSELKLRKEGLRVISDATGEKLWFPYFGYVFWTDRCGVQVAKWTIQGTATAKTPVAKYAFFKAVQAEQLWEIVSDGEVERQLSTNDRRFIISPLYSPNTGEYLAVIAKPVSAAGLSRIQFAMLISPLMSLISPVVPPGYGFAVLDADGRTLFHSISARNSRENFVRESNNNPVLRATLRDHAERALDVDYLGTAHRVYIRPFHTLQYSPWSLAVFRDRTADDAIEVEIMVLTISLGAALAITFVLAIRLVPLWFVMRRQEFPLLWFWPDANRSVTYIRLVIANLLSLIFVSLWTFSACRGAVFAGAVLLPWLVTLMNVRGLRLPTRPLLCWCFPLLVGVLVVFDLGTPEPDDHHLLRTGLLVVVAVLIPLVLAAETFPSVALAGRLGTHSYSAMLTTLMLLIGGGSCIGFYKCAFDLVSDKFVRRDQLMLVDTLESRQDRIRRYYQPIELPDNDSGTTRHTFLVDRYSSKIDRYDLVFANALDSSGRTSAKGKTSWLPYNSSQGRVMDVLLWPMQWFALNFTYKQAAEAGPLPEYTSIGARWHWRELGAGRIELEYQAVAARGEHRPGPGRAQATVPLLVAERTPFNEGGRINITTKVDVMTDPSWQLAVSYLFLSVGLYFAVEASTGALFLLGLSAFPSWEAGTEDSPEPRLILITPPLWSRPKEAEKPRASVAAAAQSSAGGHSISATGTAARPLELDLLHDTIPDRIDCQEGAVIHVYNFECALADAAQSSSKLKLLEALADCDADKVVIFTAVEPSNYFFRGGLGETADETHQVPGGESERNRWMRVLARFQIRLLQNAEIAFGSEQAARALWSTCSDSEKFVLFQLAVDGWVNSNYASAVEHLLRRGLLRRDSTGAVIRVADESFRTFVASSINPAEVSRWATENNSRLARLKAVFYITAMVLILGLLYLGRDVILPSIGGIGAVVTGLATFLKVVSELRNRSNARAD